MLRKSYYSERVLRCKCFSFRIKMIWLLQTVSSCNQIPYFLTTHLFQLFCYPFDDKKKSGHTSFWYQAIFVLRKQSFAFIWLKKYSFDPLSYPLVVYKTLLIASRKIHSTVCKIIAFWKKQKYSKYINKKYTFLQISK